MFDTRDDMQALARKVLSFSKADEALWFEMYKSGRLPSDAG